MMKLFRKISSICLLFFFCFGCQSNTDKTNEGLTEESVSQKSTNGQSSNVNPSLNEEEPVSCIDWISYYGKGTRELDSMVSKKDFKIKREGYDKYGSTNRLEGAYILTDKNMAIDKIGNLARYLAYKLCLSDNKKFNGILMDCQRRKIQVVIARGEKNYNIEAWAVVYNIFPANKKGELITLDYIK